MCDLEGRRRTDVLMTGRLYVIRYRTSQKICGIFQYTARQEWQVDLPFTITAVLGQGGFGSVAAAHSTADGSFAVKLQMAEPDVIK